MVEILLVFLFCTKGGKTLKHVNQHNSSSHDFIRHDRGNRSKKGLVIATASTIFVVLKIVKELRKNDFKKY